MAKKEKKDKAKQVDTGDWAEDFFTNLNDAAGGSTFFNLEKDDAGANVSRWVSTGCVLLDYICSSRRDGGFAEGRIIEIYGKTSIGKSHVAYQVAREAIAAGGICIYFDTEHATGKDQVHSLKVYNKKTSSQFRVSQPGCIEELFEQAEEVVKQASELRKKRDVPVVMVWDSVATTPAKVEVEAGYDDERPARQAAAISKGFKKFVSSVGNHNVLFVVINQVRMKIGVMFGNPETTTGGRALPYYASTRIALQGGSEIKNKNGDTIGIEVTAKTVKNKVASPFRNIQFEIHFGVGIKEHKQIYDMLQKFGPVTLKDGKKIECVGTKGWLYLKVDDEEVEKFYKKDFERILKDPTHGPMCYDYLEIVMKDKMGVEQGEIDGDSYEEVLSAAEAYVEGMDKDDAA